MKFSCDKNLLCEVINNASLAVASKSTIISLEGILMKCNNNQLTLTGFNLEFGIVKTIPVESSENGEIVLNAGLLSNIVNKMPSGEIHFFSDSKLLTVIRCQDVEFTILGLSAEDYPEIPVISDDQDLSVEVETFKSVVSQTLFAVSQSDQTPVYTGTLFDIKGDQLCVVSVDGYRLAMRKETIERSSSEAFHFIVPGKNLNEIQKLLAKLDIEEDGENKINVRVSSKHVILEVAEYSIISRLLEGEFLDYNSTIPKESKTSVKVNTREFMGSINRASIIINDRAKSPVKCEFADSAIHISCETALGKVQDSFPAEIDGEAVKIGFNNKYMHDALRASESDEVLIQMNGPLSPMILLPLEGDDFLFLVLPVRL